MNTFIANEWMEFIVIHCTAIYKMNVFHSDFEGHDPVK